MASQSTLNKQKVPLSAVGLYYKSLLIYFDAIAKYNQVRPLYELLDQNWMPDALAKVYQKKYNCKPAQVVDAFNQREADIKVDWNKVIIALDNLKLHYEEKDIAEFRAMAEATEEISDFRTRVRGRVERQYKNAQKEIARREQGLEPIPIYVDTPRKLLEWFRKPRRTRKKA